MAAVIAHATETMVEDKTLMEAGKETLILEREDLPRVSLLLHGQRVNSG